MRFTSRSAIAETARRMLQYKGRVTLRLNFRLKDYFRANIHGPLYSKCQMLVRFWKKSFMIQRLGLNPQAHPQTSPMSAYFTNTTS